MTTLLDSVADLTNQTREAADSRKSAALGEYRAIIERHAEPLPGDGENMLLLMAELDISESDVRADIAALVTAAQLEKTIAELETKAPDLQRRMLENVEAMKRLRDIELPRLQIECNAAEGAAKNASTRQGDRRQELANLRASRSDFLMWSGEPAEPRV